MPENDLKKFTSRRGEVLITRESMIVPMIFLLDNLPYKADVNAETGLGVIKGIELTNHEHMLVRMILSNRQGQIGLAIRPDLRQAFLALLSLVETMSGGAPWESTLENVPDPADRVTILEWKERFKNA